MNHELIIALIRQIYEQFLCVRISDFDYPVGSSQDQIFAIWGENRGFYEGFLAKRNLFGEEFDDLI